MSDSTTRQTRSRVPLEISRKLAGLILVCAIAIIWAAKEVLYPIVLAGLLALLVVPIVRALERAHIPRLLASVGTVIASSLVIGCLSWFVLNQLGGILQDMPKYEENIHRRMDEFRGTGSGLLHATGTTLHTLKKEITLDPPKTDEAPREPDKAPVPVTIAPSAQSSFADAAAVVLAILHPVLTVGMIILFAIFMLTQREDLHGRFLAVGHRLARKDGSALSAEALDEALTRISRYLVMQSLTNLATGACVGVALYLIGVPHPFFWAVMTFLLRYIPYVGVLITGLILVFFTIAVSPDWHMTLLTVVVYFGIELIVGNAIEPFIFGHGTGLSSFAIIIAATFWTWIWGPVGLFVSVPLTVCLVVIGRYVPSMDFLEIILADRTPRKQPRAPGRVGATHVREPAV